MALPLVAAAHPAVGIVVDRTGSVFYSDTVHVWTVRPDGTKAIVVRDVHTHELWLDADGVLYGEHLWYEGDATGRWGHRVWKRTPDGVVSEVISARPGFLSDYRDFSFTRDAPGAMFWMEGSRPAYLRMKPQGREAVTLASFTSTPPGWGPTGIAVAADGTVWVLEASITNAQRVRRIGRDGTGVLGSSIRIELNRHSVALELGERDRPGRRPGLARTQAREYDAEALRARAGQSVEAGE